MRPRYFSSRQALVATPVSGRMMSPGNQQIEIDVDRLPAGAYHLRGRTRQGIRTREFVIAR
jgi:hypothetical protein